jgi:trehalose/maltose transport system substrate-binding protein
MQTGDSPVKGKIGVSVLPKGGQHGRSASVLGGWGLCVSRYSRNREVAIDLVRWLTRPKEQHRRALIASYCPTIRSLYQDSELLAANPFFEQVGQTLETAILRPAKVFGRLYAQVSTSVANLVQKVISKKLPPDVAAQKLEKDITDFYKRASELEAAKN